MWTVTVSSGALRNGSRALAWYGLALVVVVLDQYTKNLASGALQYARPVEVLSWFNLTLQHNTGAAFSFLSTSARTVSRSLVARTRTSMFPLKAQRSP